MVGRCCLQTNDSLVVPSSRAVLGRSNQDSTRLLPAPAAARRSRASQWRVAGTAAAHAGSALARGRSCVMPDPSIRGSAAWCWPVQCVLLCSLGPAALLGTPAQRASARLRPAEPGPRCNTPRYDIKGQRSRVPHSAPSRQPSREPRARCASIDPRRPAARCRYAARGSHIMSDPSEGTHQAGRFPRPALAATRQLTRQVALLQAPSSCCCLPSCWRTSYRCWTPSQTC